MKPLVITIALHVIQLARIVMAIQARTAHLAIHLLNSYRIYNNVLFLSLVLKDFGLMLARIVGHATHIAQNVMEVINSNVLPADRDILKLIKNQVAFLFVH
jgi:hypothetical protein